MEYFKTIEEFPDYEISDLGRIRSKRNNKILKQFISQGYLKITLYKDKKGYPKFVHRVKALTFISNPDNKPEVNHKDGNKLNNSLSNLEWNTRKENQKHAYLNDLQKSKKGRKNVKSKKVKQKDLHNTLIRVWDSVMDIERELGIKSGAISNCCLNKCTTSHGFKWEYIY